MKKLLLFLSIISFTHVFAEDLQVPGTIKGNWFNEKNNQWEIGFFENFAVYDCDFWSYSYIKEDKKQIEITLQKGNQTLQVKTQLKNDTTVQITFGKQKTATYRLIKKNHPEYTIPDQTPFQKPDFTSDTVTLIGYYRNRTGSSKQPDKKNNPPVFSVVAPNFISGNEDEYHADIDLSGRFQIRFPVMNTQYISLDRSRLSGNAIVQPKDTLFLFVDGRDILFMGKNARINNELIQYKSPSIFYDCPNWSKQKPSDEQLLDMCKKTFQQRLQANEQFFYKNPEMSYRIKEFIDLSEKIQLPDRLMQYYTVYRDENLEKNKAFLDSVSTYILWNDETAYTLMQSYSLSLTSYINSDLEGSSSIVEVYDFMKKQELCNPDKAIDGLLTVMEEKKKIPSFSSDSLVIIQEQLIERMQSFMMERIENYLIAIACKTQEIISTKTTSSHLKELWITSVFYHLMDNSKKKLSDSSLQFYVNNVSTPYLRDYILRMSDYYAQVSHKGLSYAASLVNTDHLKEASDANTLWKELIAPYKGKVIYVDFWGTWCGPCREEMKYAGGIKEEFKSKDVIFMYFPNRSAEDLWKNFIKEMDLTGENIVHYRLPDSQESMIERKLSVRSFPTYFIIDKEGNIARENAPSPKEKLQLIDQINHILKKSPSK